MASSILVLAVMHSLVSNNVAVPTVFVIESDNFQGLFKAEFSLLFSENLHGPSSTTPVDLFSICAVNRLEKTFSEIFTEESINEGVQHAVGVT